MKRTFSKRLGIAIGLGRWLLAGATGSAAVAQTMAAKSLIVAITLVTGVLTARFLAPTGRGEQAAMAMWPQFLAYSMTLGIPTSLRYYLRREPEEHPRLVAGALVVTAVLAVVAAATGVLIVPKWLSQYSPSVVAFAQALMVFVPVEMFADLFVSFLNARCEFSRANEIALIPPAATLIGLVALASVHHLNPFSSTLCYVGASALTFCWTLWRVWPFLALRFKGAAAAAGRLLHYGARSYGIDLLGMLSMQIDQVLVVGMLSPGSMGIYTVALSVSRLLHIIHTSVNTVLFPKASSLMRDDIVELTNRAARISTATTVLAAVALIVVAPIVVPLFYGRAFAAAVPIAQILTLEAVLAGATWVLAQAFMAAGKPGVVTILQALGLGVCVPLMLWLIPLYGLAGAAFALMGSTAVRFVLVSLAYPALLGAPLPRLVLRRADLSHVRAVCSAALRVSASR